jgi:hypothetical protein
MRWAIYTAANGPYLEYAKMFRACASVAYPGARVIVDELDNVPVRYYSACYRLLNEVSGYDHVYVTDVDMAIMAETPGLLDFHIGEMAREGLPYSNSIRSAGEPHGRYRVTGLHFVGRDWWEKTRASRRKYMGRLVHGSVGKGRFDDELILRHVILESGMELPSKKPLSSRHHGIHFGILRAYRKHPKKVRWNQMSLRIHPWHARRWLSYLGHPEIKKATSGGPAWFRWEMGEMKRFCEWRAG